MPILEQNMTKGPIEQVDLDSMKAYYDAVPDSGYQEIWKAILGHKNRRLKPLYRGMLSSAGVNPSPYSSVKQNLISDDRISWDDWVVVGNVVGKDLFCALVKGRSQNNGSRR